MANRGGLGRSAAVVVVVLLAALLVVGAEAGRNHRHRHRRHRHHSPPAPPGYNEPMAAPSPPYFRGEPSASPADSPDGFPFPETFTPSEGPGPAAAGPEGYQPRRLSESGSLADSPFAFGEGPAPQLPEPGC